MRQPLSLILSSFAVLVSSFAAPPPPNIVIIFMDDMGYADVSCFGAQGYQTPHIDKLAAEGRKFTNSTSPSPSAAPPAPPCSPAATPTASASTAPSAPPPSTASARMK